MQLDAASWSKCFSFVLCDTSSAVRLAATGRDFRALTSSTLSWKGSTFCICAADLGLSEVQHEEYLSNTRPGGRECTDSMDVKYLPRDRVTEYDSPGHFRVVAPEAGIFEHVQETLGLSHVPVRFRNSKKLWDFCTRDLEVGALVAGRDEGDGWLRCELQPFVKSKVSSAGLARSLDVAVVEHKPLSACMISTARLCRQIFVDFSKVEKAIQHYAAAICFSQLAQICIAAEGLFLRGWSRLENNGLPHLTQGFFALQHLELSGCDTLSSYGPLVPVLLAHPKLRSLRCFVRPSESMTFDFAQAIPSTLMALGYVTVDDPEVLDLLLNRCGSALEHLWFASGLVRNGTASLPSKFVRLLVSATKLRTLCVPTHANEELVLELTEALQDLGLLACPDAKHFGTRALADSFERLPNTGVVLKKRGLDARLASNGALWSPYIEHPVAEY